MRTVFLCGFCQGKLAADSSQVGNPVKCPRCQATVAVPDPEGAADEFDDELDPEPRRSPSRRFDRQKRGPRRQATSGIGATKAAVIAVIGLAVVATAVVVALVVTKSGVARKGGGTEPEAIAAIPPEDRFPADYLRDAPPPNFLEHRLGRARVFLTGHVRKTDGISKWGEVKRLFSWRTVDVLLGETKNFAGVEETDEAMIARASEIVPVHAHEAVTKVGERRILVSGYPGREIRLRVGDRKVVILRSVVADGDLYSMSATTFFEEQQATDEFQIASRSFAIVR